MIALALARPRRLWVATIAAALSSGAALWLFIEPPSDAIDVAAAMASAGVEGAAPAGGVGVQLPRDHEARPFRLGPSDRDASYYFEDPYVDAYRSCWGGPASGFTIELDDLASTRETLRYVVRGDLSFDTHRALALSVHTSRAVVIEVHGDVRIADDVIVDGGGSLTIEARGQIAVGDPAFQTLDRVDARLIAGRGIAVDPSARNVTLTR